MQDFCFCLILIVSLPQCTTDCFIAQQKSVVHGGNKQSLLMLISGKIKQKTNVMQLYPEYRQFSLTTLQSSVLLANSLLTLVPSGVLRAQLLN